MKKLLLLLTGLGLLLSSCKKDRMPTNADLNVSGYGPLMFASGDAISIYGSGFDPNPENNTVLFEGMPGEVASATPNRLQVIVPSLTVSGKITVKVNGKAVISDLSYTLLNVITSSSQNTILSRDKKYLLRGNVDFSGKLSIQAGTVIYCEKATHANLTVHDIDFEGTATNPIVFTSDQPPGRRQPGDWGGIAVAQLDDTDIGGNTVALANGVMKYVRIEYCSDGLSLLMLDKNVFEHLQVSYSLGGGFVFTTPALGSAGAGFKDGFASYLVAFAVQGADFKFTGPQANVQYALGLKDPYAAYGSGQGVVVGQGVKYSSFTQIRLSNFTLVGYNPVARNVLGTSPGFPLNKNAGRTVQVGGNYLNDSEFRQKSVEFAMYNSVIAGGWLAGISMIGKGDGYNGAPWDDYENSGNGYLVSMRGNFIAGTGPALYPFRGGAFARENYKQISDGFENVQGDPQLALFASYNDTTRVLDFNLKKDDLGIAGLADYKNLNHPLMLPSANSALQTGAKFPLGSPVDNPAFNKDVKFSGAFGTQDWTAGWCNFNPQTTKY